MKAVWVMVLLGLSASPAPAGAGARWKAAFPGERAVLGSPDGRHQIRWVPPADEADQHHLLLSDASDGHEVELLAFQRGIDALWSRSGSHLAVTNRWASDEATVLLWDSLSGRPRDLLKELAEHEQQRAARWNAHHIYLVAEGWQGDDALLLRLWGYGDPSKPAVERRYKYVLGRGFSRK
jgi:hypothetical protein